MKKSCPDNDPGQRSAGLSRRADPRHQFLLRLTVAGYGDRKFIATDTTADSANERFVGVAAKVEKPVEIPAVVNA